jgi:uncharacterized OB-fold protein
VSSITPSATLPIVDYLVLEADGGAHLEANRCLKCGERFFDRRNACACCGQREFDRVTLKTTGTLRSYTIVYRAAKNVPAPYVSAVVDLDDGGVIKANLIGGRADPDTIRLGGRVRLATFVADTDDDGCQAIAFGFSSDGSTEEDL